MWPGIDDIKLARQVGLKDKRMKGAVEGAGTLWSNSSSPDWPLCCNTLHITIQNQRPWASALILMINEMSQVKGL